MYVLYADNHWDYMRKLCLKVCLKLLMSEYNAMQNTGNFSIKH